MKAYQAKYTIAMLSRMLEVSASGYYAGLSANRPLVRWQTCNLGIELKHCIASRVVCTDGRESKVIFKMRAFT